MRKIKLLWIAFALACCYPAMAERQGKCFESLDIKTYTYAVKGQDTLRLDVYLDPAAQTEGKRPVFIYAFGGGWEMGSRDAGANDFFNLLPVFARKGYVAIGIDYRLGFLEARKSGKVEDKSIIEYIKGKQLDQPQVFEALNTSIRYAVEDLYDATSYVVKNAGRWNADTEFVVTCGSSAGAVTALTAENLLCNGDELARKHLPEGFRYAAVVPFAGGIWKYGTGDLEWKEKPCPIMMFHGDKDDIAPYATEVLPKVGATIYGTKDIAEQLYRIKSPYALFTEVGSDHNMAGMPVLFNLPDIFSFIKRAVIDKEQIALDIRERGLDMPRDEKWYANVYLKGLMEKNPEFKRKVMEALMKAAALQQKMQKK